MTHYPFLHGRVHNSCNRKNNSATMKGIPPNVALSFLCLASQPLRAATFAAPPPAAFGRPMTTTTTEDATKKIERLPIINTAVVAVTSSSLDHHCHASSSRWTRNFTAVKSKTSRDDVAADMGGGGGGDDDAPFGMRINPPYAIAYVLFLSYAYLRSSSEPDGASMEILQRFLDNPTNPEGVNELFVTVFNLLGLYAAPIACLLLPGAGRQSLPAAPFVLGSMFGGYGALGIYAMSRTPDATSSSKSDLGWFTSNVLENKVFNWVVVFACASAFVTSGAFGALVADPANLIGGYAEMMSGSAIVSVSSLDFAILTLTAASFVPEDLSRRGYRGDVDPAWIAASTMLLPGLGVSLYCALRPSLVDEE